MAGEAVRPSSSAQVTAGRVFPSAPSQAKFEDLDLEADLGADSTWKLMFEPPDTPDIGR